ncbi:unnamed protein product [Cuscuta campestris]|uniref:SWIM-type domain-containing protein n=1 Tax=Cuscuta campestris TaxID=132261 RepID=A0A484K8V9_9ASTE|nr:unnamed protein product [Cuscuta campestris]
MEVASKKIIAVCQAGGEFVTNKDDGSLSYIGGEAYAVDVDDQTTLDGFKKELSENFQCATNGITIKYFLPGNKKTLITVSKDKDLKRMLSFFNDSDQVDVFMIPEDAAIRNMPASRSSRTTVSEATMTPHTPMDLINPDDQIMVDTPIDIAPLGDFSSVNDDKHRRAAMQWENTITGVDQRFSSFAEFREALHKFSIAHGFSYKYKKNDSHRVTVKCKAEGCPWRVYASRLATTQLVCIKKMNSTHTCEGAAVKAGYRATKGWVGKIIKEKLKISPNYKPKDIASDIKREYGITLNYSQAWRAKEIAREQLQGSYKEAYTQIPLFCQKIKETNPGSLATFATKEDSSFHRLRLMVQDLYAAAYAPKLEEFGQCAENIKAISPEAYNWVMRSEPDHWANAFFGGARYDQLTCNFGQPFYDWVSEVNELPITQMVDVLRGKMMELMYTRRVESSQWVEKLTPCMEHKLQNEIAKAQSLRVLASHGSVFEVQGETLESLDIDHWDCTCKGWQLNGIPCCHAIAVFEYLGYSLYDYCSRYFTTECYRLTYAESINPVPNVEKLVPDEQQAMVLVTPPPNKRPPGRPKMKQADPMDIIKRQLQCSKCKGLGHNKKTCGKVNNTELPNEEEYQPESLLLTVHITEEKPNGSS